MPIEDIKLEKLQPKEIEMAMFRIEHMYPL